MNGKWLGILRANGQTDLGAALVQLARHAADRHMALIDSPTPDESIDTPLTAPAELPMALRRLVQEARS